MASAASAAQVGSDAQAEASAAHKDRARRQQEKERGRGLSIPVRLLLDAWEHNVTVELKSGEIYRGRLLSSESNMNCQLAGVTHTARDGKITKMDQVFLRGSAVRLFVVPDLLKNAPFLQSASELGQKVQSEARAKKRARTAGRKNLYQRRRAAAAK